MHLAVYALRTSSHVLYPAQVGGQSLTTRTVFILTTGSVLGPGCLIRLVDTPCRFGGTSPTYVAPII
jgi:hypothetical protein